MKKTILITGSTDGLGLVTAKLLAKAGHRVLLHGRSQAKLEAAEQAVSAASSAGYAESYLADLSCIGDVEALAAAVAKQHQRLDVLINSAGVYAVRDPLTESGIDVRFLVNTIAPYLLTLRLQPLLGTSGRVINLSSAAQAPVDLLSLAGRGRHLSDSAAYAQSKLALTMWSHSLAQSRQDAGPVIIAVNPGSLLATKMVKEAYGIAGADINTGADILVRAALDDEFSVVSGRYFDNDVGDFASPHPDALDVKKSEQLVIVLDTLLSELGNTQRLADAVSRISNPY